MFEDQHFRTSAQAEWLSELLLPKLNLKPNLVKYKEIIDIVDSMYYSTPDKERLQREFEKRLFHTKFNLPKWPNMIKGFYYF
jgi:aspartyl/asparaginyl-tRNA synthetase